MRLIRILFITFCIFLLTDLCRADQASQNDPTTASSDSLDTTLPQYPGKSFGSYMLDVPEVILSSPIYVVKGISWFAIEGIYRNGTLRRIVNQFVAFEPVEGFKPVISYGSNKGLRYGAGWEFFDTFKQGDDLFIKGSYSTNEYQKHSIKYSAPSIFSRDAGLKLLLQYQTRTRESFYGLGNDSRNEDKVSYYLEESVVSATTRWRTARGLAVEVTGGWIRSNTFDGKSTQYVNSLDSSKTLLGLTDLDLANAQFLRIGGTIELDWRDNKGQPSRGGQESVSVTYSKGIGDSDDLSYITTRAEAAHYFNLYHKRIIALRLIAQSIDVKGDVPVIPFQFRSGLGDANLLRGYTTNRFIDNDLTAAAIEYRWPIWDLLDAFIFAEAGRVYGSITKEFTLKNWHESIGTGLRLWNRDGVILLLQGAFGEDDTQFYLELGGEW